MALELELEGWMEMCQVKREGKSREIRPGRRKPERNRQQKGPKDRSLFEADGIILSHNCVMVFLHEAKCSFLKPKVAFCLVLYFQSLAQFPAHILEVFYKCLWNK